MPFRLFGAELDSGHAFSCPRHVKPTSTAAVVITEPVQTCSAPHSPGAWLSLGPSRSCWPRRLAGAQPVPVGMDSIIGFPPGTVLSSARGCVRQLEDELFSGSTHVWALFRCVAGLVQAPWRQHDMESDSTGPHLAVPVYRSALEAWQWLDSSWAALPGLVWTVACVTASASPCRSARAGMESPRHAV